ncbi:hypothetical protein MSAN_00642600 [Mycena sanguinolenta]|uniref:Uncharacterized protein n=1 Tax=Mycena sanguinolenta TaxID=230812 RepID=A0A8H6Z362_9AGAR|nr:hypothetical protein MSAN_00642600 [Mycena sanguinolenta]
MYKRTVIARSQRPRADGCCPLDFFLSILSALHERSHTLYVIMRRIRAGAPRMAGCVLLGWGGELITLSPAHAMTRSRLEHFRTPLEAPDLYDCLAFGVRGSKYTTILACFSLSICDRSIMQSPGPPACTTPSLCVRHGGVRAHVVHTLVAVTTAEGKHAPMQVDDNLPKETVSSALVWVSE